MKGAVNRLGRTAFGFAIVAALAFGGFQALAGPTNAMAPCDEEPPDFGTCVDQMDCQLKCDAFYGQGQAQGFCQPHEGQMCCICIEL